MKAGNLLFAGMQGRVVAVDVDKAQIVWSAVVDGSVYAIAVTGSELVVSTDSGRLYCFR